MAIEEVSREKPAENLEKIEERTRPVRPGEIKPTLVRSKVERLPPRLRLVSEADAQTLRQLKGENSFERPAEKAPPLSRARGVEFRGTEFRGTEARAEPNRQWQPPAGVPRGLKGFFVNLGGGLVGLLERVGLKFKVSPYFLSLSDRLARSSRPESEEDFAKWMDEGVTAAVSLTGETDKFTERAAAHGFAAKRFAITDNTARRDILSTQATQDAVMDQYIRDIADFIRANKKTVIHCQAGIGRTGMVIACLQIMMHGMSEKDAIAEALEVARTYSKVKRVVMVPAQVEFIHRFAQRFSAGQIPGYPPP